MARAYWLVKSDPDAYSWDDLVRDGSTYWDGVRNYQARNYLAAMHKGDLVLYYHSGADKQVVGVTRVTGEAYPDPSTKDERWVVVDLEPVRAFTQPVSLAEIKAEPSLAKLALIRQSRLSVMPVERKEFERILRLGKTRITTR